MEEAERWAKTGGAPVHAIDQEIPEDRWPEMEPRCPDCDGPGSTWGRIADDGKAHRESLSGMWREADAEQRPASRTSRSRAVAEMSPVGVC